MNGMELPSDFFINDGYAVTATINARPGLHGALSFTYRPATLEERETEYSGRGGSSKSAIQSMARLLSRKIQSWSLEGVEITAVNLARLKPALFDRLFAIVVGVMADDAGQRVDAEAEAKN